VADPQLLRSFRFGVSLVRSPQARAGDAGAPPTVAGGFSFDAGAAIGLSASASVEASAGAGLSAGAGFSAGAGLSAGVSLGAGIGFGDGGGDRLQLGDGGFAECSGLDVEMDVQELQEGGRNDGVIRCVGRGRYQSIVLRRGMLFPRGDAVNMELWQWLQDVVAGVRPVARYDGIVDVMDLGDEGVARWAFSRGLPARISGPQLNAKTGEVAIEELHIAHEGLRLVTP
jgi:phage tail-like protein